jgi:hypothetical protein
VAAAWLLAWATHGSIDAADWLPAALFVGVLLGSALLSGRAALPTRAAAIATAALVLLAVWAVVTVAWSPAPALARDEGLLVLLYAGAFALTAVTLTRESSRHAAVAVLAAAAGGLAVATALLLRFGSSPVAAFHHGRLYSLPVSYGPAQAAFVLTGVWPGVVLAARRESSTAARAGGLAAAVAAIAIWLMTQTRTDVVAVLAATVVVVTLSPLRRRLVVPALLLVPFAVVGFRPLTAPYTATYDGTGTLPGTIRHAGTVTLWLVFVAALVGALYALVDARFPLAVPSRGAGLGVVAILATAACALAGAVPHPEAFVSRHWAMFKAESQNPGGSSHFTNPGSDRYDFWRVALRDARAHPVSGIGARGFASSYLAQRHSTETPARAHSLPLDVFAEEGLVGLGLLIVALVAAFRGLIRGTRAQSPAATAALGGAAYWLTHAGVDWTWTFPAVGLPFMVLLGIGAGGDGARRISGSRSVASGVLALAVAVVAFVPPWLSARLTAHALSAPAVAGSDLRWARRLDPLSTRPDVAAYALARTPAARVHALFAALKREPRSVGLRMVLANELLADHDGALARTILLQAQHLDPTEPAIETALRRARR